MNITNCTFAGHTGNGEALMMLRLFVLVEF
jgi:hypothetical protein